MNDQFNYDGQYRWGLGLSVALVVGDCLKRFFSLFAPWNFGCQLSCWLLYWYCRGNFCGNSSPATMAPLHYYGFFGWFINLFIFFCRSCFFHARRAFYVGRSYSVYASYLFNRVDHSRNCNGLYDEILFSLIVSHSFCLLQLIRMIR